MTTNHEIDSNNISTHTSNAETLTSEHVCEYEILLFYKYTKIEHPEAFKAWQRAICTELGLTGRVLIAPEGINGTLEGTKESTKEYQRVMQTLDGTKSIIIEGETYSLPIMSDVQFKHSEGTGSAFPKLKVKVRPEIVALKLGNEDLDPNEVTGQHITPKELRAWYENGEEFFVYDMRNDYEFKVGHFKNSINSGLENFRDLPEKVQEIEHLKGKKVLAVCTGGVRCEKATGFLKKKGFENVYQLEGGMHMYMQEYPGKDFLGALYTFDNRITMDFTKEREVVGRCEVCDTKNEVYSHCDNDPCHRRLLICDTCRGQYARIYCCGKCQIAHEKHVVTEGGAKVLDKGYGPKEGRAEYVY
jgi:UPF0176 protein